MQLAKGLLVLATIMCLVTGLVGATTIEQAELKEALDNKSENKIGGGEQPMRDNEDDKIEKKIREKMEEKTREMKRQKEFAKEDNNRDNGLLSIVFGIF